MSNTLKIEKLECNYFGCKRPATYLDRGNYVCADCLITVLINTVISKDQEIEELKKETNFVYRCDECGNEIGDEYAYLYDGTIKCKECEEEDDDE